MSVFNRGERVRIIDPEKNSSAVYRIRDMKKIRNGGTLYLLKSLERLPYYGYIMKIGNAS